MYHKTGLLMGMSRDQLKAALNTAQQAYLDLASGTKGFLFLIPKVMELDL